MIRALTTAVIALAALWAGWWFIASQAAGRALDNIIADLRADGWQVDYSDINTRGFPSRIDTTARDLSLTDPGGRVTWETPDLQAFALSYRPNEIIVAWPRTQTFTLPSQKLVLDADSLMASARVGIATDLPLRNATIQSDLVTLTSDAGWRIGAAHLLGALRGTPAADGAEAVDASYDLFAELQELTLPTGAVSGPDGVGTLRIDATVVLDTPLALGVQSRIEAITLREARVDWGATALAISGDVVADEGGFARGAVELELRNWPQLLDALIEAGLVAPDDANRLRSALAFAASGDNTLSAPLMLSGGVVLLGGLVPLGPAPRLHR